MVDMYVEGPSELDLMTAHSFHGIVERRKLTTKVDKPGIYHDQTFQKVALKMLGDDISADVVEGELKGRPKPETVELVHELIDDADTKDRVEKGMAALEKLNIELDSQALVDHLTGMPNKRYFDAEIKSQIDRVDRNELGSDDLAIAMMDVNNFKDGVNDTYGHVVGDKVLSHIGTALRDVTRESDFVARFGGDEIALILPTLREKMEFFGDKDGLNKDGKKSLFIRINESIGDFLRNSTDLPEGFNWDPGITIGGVPIYLAAGVAFLSESSSYVGNSRSEKLIGMADEELFKFKRARKVGRGIKKDN